MDSLDGRDEEVDSSPSKESLHPVGSLEEGEELSEDHDDRNSENKSKSNVSSSDLSKKLKHQGL